MVSGQSISTLGELSARSDVAESTGSERKSFAKLASRRSSACFASACEEPAGANDCNDADVALVHLFDGESGLGWSESGRRREEKSDDSKSTGGNRMKVSVISRE